MLLPRFILAASFPENELVASWRPGVDRFFLSTLPVRAGDAERGASSVSCHSSTAHR